MTLKFPKQYLVLGAVIAGLAALLVVVGLSRSCTGQSLPALSKIKKDDISKIVFTSVTNGELALEKDKDGKWKMIPLQYPADKSAVESMLTNITDIAMDAFISDKKIYERYNLDDANKISVTAFAADKVVRNFDIGKVLETSSFTYVKLADNPNVYQVKGNVRSVFDKKPNDIRDKVVMNLQREEITAFTLESGGKKVVIRKELNKVDVGATPDPAAGDQSMVWKSDLSDKGVSDTVINELFDGMINLTCDDFIQDKTKQDFADKPFYYRVTARGAKDYVVTYMDSGIDNQYTGISSESDYPFKVAGWKATKLTRKFENGEIK